MKSVKRWFKIAIGLIVTVVGLILMPVPGPGGTPVTLAGLAILSTELEWAKRLMNWFVARLEKLKIHKASKWQKAGMIAGALIFYGATSLLVTRFILSDKA